MHNNSVVVDGQKLFGGWQKLSATAEPSRYVSGVSVYIGAKSKVMAVAIMVVIGELPWQFMAIFIIENWLPKNQHIDTKPQI
jgi:hypothetical protein